MNRRTFLTISTAALSATALPAWASVTEYTPGAVDAALAEGKTVFLDFYASWCSTCARQERVINALLAEKPEYAENIAFFKADWDKYSRGELARRLKIPRRSTLVVLQGDQELGRLVAGTGKKEIRALMDTALTAATGA